MNVYAYVHNSPINHIDPLGLLLGVDEDDNITSEDYTAQPLPPRLTLQGGPIPVSPADFPELTPEGRPLPIHQRQDLPTPQELAELRDRQEAEWLALTQQQRQREFIEDIEGGFVLAVTKFPGYAFDVLLLVATGTPPGARTVAARTLGRTLVADTEYLAAKSETLTFFRGTTYYDALETVGNNAFNMERILQRQAAAGHGSDRLGIFLTSQEQTANYYASLAGIQGRSGGPAMLRIEVPRTQFESLMERYGIQYEVPVPRPPFPGQTESLIPPAAASEFNSMMRVFHH